MLRCCHRHASTSQSRLQSFLKQHLFATHSKSASSYAYLHNELTSRRLPLLYDQPTALPSYLLEVTLADFLPPRKIPIARHLPFISGFGRNTPPTHHLIYFPPPSRLSALLPDGTDPEQSPGEPFVRRMWAGGRINFRPSRQPTLKLLGRRAVCLERIADVAIKGTTGDEKIYVTIERRVSQVTSYGDQRTALDSKYVGEAMLRQRLMHDKFCSIIEHRNIVFMRERTGEAATEAGNTPAKILKPQYEPTFSHTLTPTAALLFRFSALTFNAHRIHLDKQYCQSIEGHRNLLVHGPLSLVLMVELLRRHLSYIGADSLESGPRTHEVIDEIEYRNLAPLYAEEPMKVCGRAKREGEWEVWIEGRDGGYAVKGTVKTSQAYHRLSDFSESRAIKLESDAASDEPDPAPRHTLEDPKEYGTMPIAS